MSDRTFELTEDDITWEVIRSRASHGLHVWLSDAMTPGDDPAQWLVLFEFRPPDEEGNVALGLNAYDYTTTTYDLRREHMYRWPECDEHKLLLNMGPPNQRKGTYFCCYCGRDYDLVAKKIVVPDPDLGIGGVMDLTVVTIVEPS